MLGYFFGRQRGLQLLLCLASASHVEALDSNVQGLLTIVMPIGTAEEAAKKAHLCASPKEAIEKRRLAASLKRCHDTNPSFFASCEAVLGPPLNL
jgi:hypothetical protein